MATIETDYLVVGGGAAGMAFADSLIAECEADVVMVERRHRPGGHWNSAYPFVRLHQPSAFYGVNSMVLGSDAIDSEGPNAGLYERATAPAICEYFRRVLEEHLLPSGRVRFLAMTDYVGDMRTEHRVVSRLTGRPANVVIRELVDARFLEPSVPATHAPSFEVDPQVRFIPINNLVNLASFGSGFAIGVGDGKTAMDACVWLLGQGVDPRRGELDPPAGCLAARPQVPAAPHVAASADRRGVVVPRGRRRGREPPDLSGDWRTAGSWCASILASRPPCSGPRP